MPFEFKFPDIGEGLSEGEVVEWKVKPGDRVEDHQILLEVETDKAVAEVASPRSGYIISIKGGPGDVINVGEVIAVIGDESELKAAQTGQAIAAPLVPAASEPAPPAAAPAVMTTEARHGSVGVVGQLEEAPDDEDETAATNTLPVRVAVPRVEALPKDRMLARALGVDIGRVRGSGPKGRVTEADIRAHSEAGVPEKGVSRQEGAPGADAYGAVERVPLRGVRRKIAQGMVDSLTKAAQVSCMDEADAGLLWHIREKEKDKANEAGVKLSLLPFIVKAVVGALKRDPFMNASMDDEASEIVVKGYYNIGIAVETEDGLIVPNVKDADRKSVLDIAREIESLAMKARKRTLDIKELRGGTFTITNYGSIGGLYATPVLNYPETGILGVGRMYDKPAVVNGAIRIKKALPLSLTFDHRVIDGAKAQHFLNNIIRRIEDPDIMLVGV